MYEEKEIKYKKKTKKPIKLNIKKNKKKTFFNSIDWKKILTKLGLLLLFMILIIFIISRINKNEQNNNIVINKNFEKVTNASLNYFNNENIPHNIGDSTSFLLDEMMQKNLIDKIIDKNEKNCNYINSYIILTKMTNQEYKLKIYLTCPSEEGVKEYTLICNNDCQIKK